MNIIHTSFEGLVVIEPQIWKDDRGYFFESYHEQKFKEAGIHAHFVQDNEAQSNRGSLRGLHYQSGEYAQAKLVRVTAGEVLDVVVDLREDQPTYGQSFSIILNDITKKQLFVPRGFAHGYISLVDDTIFQYKCDNFYHKESEGGVHYADPHLKIDWLLDSELHIVSPKDQELPIFGKHRKI